MSLQVSKGESRPHFCTAAFLFCICKYDIIFSGYVSVYAIYFSFKCNISKILSLVATEIPDEIKFLCMYVTFSGAVHAYTL